MRNAYQLSQDEEILLAEPIELVVMLYRAAIQAVQKARTHLAAGEITERGQQISRASAILTELSLTLNHEIGGTLSLNLAELYDYLQRLLLTAHQQQSVEKLAQAQNLLETLLDGWTNADTHPSGAARPMYGAGMLETSSAHQPLTYQF